MKLPITIGIPVLNEAKNLPECLQAIGHAFEDVIVVDSGSTDATREIALGAGVKVLDFKWNGSHPKKRNWFLRNYIFHTPWVLFLDADEIMSAEFIKELEVKLPDTPHHGFWISFTNWFFGSPMRHGDVFRKLALFRVGSGEYEVFPEAFWSKLDMEVHEHPIIDGSLGSMEVRLEHRDFRGLHHYIQKHNEYSTWEANRYYWLSSAPTTEWEKLTSRQRFKYRNLQRWWLSWIYFFASYVAKRGFLDGSVGWQFNWLKNWISIQS